MRPLGLCLAAVFACGSSATTTDAGMDASGDVIGVDGHTEAGSGLTTITVLNAMGASLVSFPIGASGNVAPTSVITGSSTNIDNASALAADAEGNLYVSTELAILVFPPGATGNVTAARTIAGPNALATTDGFVSVAVAPDGTIYAASELQSGTNRAPQILVFPAGSNGNVAPSATIAGSSTTMQAVLAMGVSTQVAEADATQNILFFDTTDTGNVAPQHTLSLGAGLVEGLAFGPSNDLSLAIWDFSASSVVTYAAGAQGTDTPIATLTGVSTTITNAGGVAVDASGEIYVTSADGTTASILVFTPNATGDVAPTRTITGSATMLSGDASQYPMPIVVVARVTD